MLVSTGVRPRVSEGWGVGWMRVRARVSVCARVDCLVAMVTSGALGDADAEGDRVVVTDTDAVWLRSVLLSVLLSMLLSVLLSVLLFVLLFVLLLCVAAGVVVGVVPRDEVELVVVDDHS